LLGFLSKCSRIVESGLFLLMNHEVLDVFDETLEIFIGVVFLLESIDAATVWENC
jgi:hypothetical protein